MIAYSLEGEQLPLLLFLGVGTESYGVTLKDITQSYSKVEL
jgi:hypothetical protein